MIVMRDPVVFLYLDTGSRVRKLSLISADLVAPLAMSHGAHRVIAAGARAVAGGGIIGGEYKVMMRLGLGNI